LGELLRILLLLACKVFISLEKFKALKMSFEILAKQCVVLAKDGKDCLEVVNSVFYTWLRDDS